MVKDTDSLGLWLTAQLGLRKLYTYILQCHWWRPYSPSAAHSFRNCSYCWKVLITLKAVLSCKHFCILHGTLASDIIENIIWLDELGKQALKGKARRNGKISLILFWWMNISNTRGQLLTNSLQGTESRQPTGWTSKKSSLSQTIRWNDRPHWGKRPGSRWKEVRISGEGGKKDEREKSCRPLPSRQGGRKQFLCMKLPETRTKQPTI